MKKIGIIVLWAVVAVMVLGAGYAVYNKSQTIGNAGQPGQSQKMEQVPQKMEAPDFELKDLNGQTVKLSDYRGKMVFLNFWTTWCTYCIKEMPEFDEAAQELAKEGKAVILTVDVCDNPKETEENARKFLKDKNISNLTVLMDTTTEVAQMYGVRGYPTTYVINPDGTIYNVIPGATNKSTILEIAKTLK